MCCKSLASSRILAEDFFLAHWKKGVGEGRLLVDDRSLLNCAEMPAKLCLVGSKDVYDLSGRGLGL